MEVILCFDLLLYSCVALLVGYNIWNFLIKQKNYTNCYILTFYVLTSTIVLSRLIYLGLNMADFNNSADKEDHCWKVENFIIDIPRYLMVLIGYV